eukprot:6454740-Amphidinium_carterae.1
MGTAAIAMHELGSYFATVAWEPDLECGHLLRKLPSLVAIREDIFAETPQSLHTLADVLDPSGSKPVLFTGGPPCWDHSWIKRNAPGASGAEGRKTLIAASLVQKFSSLSSRQTAFLFEQVVPQQVQEVELITEALACKYVLIDAADFGVIRRPRLWFSQVDWSQMPCQRSSEGPHPRVHVDTDRQPAMHDLVPCRLHPDVVARKRLLPTMTTPTPSPAGRPSPQPTLKFPADVIARWKADGQRFAPWHYHDYAMAQTPDGQLR